MELTVEHIHFFDVRRNRPKALRGITTWVATKIIAIMIMGRNRPKALRGITTYSDLISCISRFTLVGIDRKPFGALRRYFAIKPYITNIFVGIDRKPFGALRPVDVSPGGVSSLPP